MGGLCREGHLYPFHLSFICLFAFCLFFIMHTLVCLLFSLKTQKKGEKFRDVHRSNGLNSIELPLLHPRPPPPGEKSPSHTPGTHGLEGASLKSLKVRRLVHTQLPEGTCLDCLNSSHLLSIISIVDYSLTASKT